MNKAEFIVHVASVGKITKAEAERCVNLFIDATTKGLSKGQSITFVGFGSFSVQKRKAREGRNPKTGEKMRIAAYSQPVFKAGKKLKAACN